jgi:hypothetical protein
MSRVRSVRGLLAVLLVLPALALAGCGGGGAGGGAAEVVPAGAAVYVSIDTDFDGGQWQQAEELVRKFPDGPRTLQMLLRDLEQQEDVDFDRDVRPAVGPEVAFALLDIPAQGGAPQAVALTQPEDEAKLRALLEKGTEPAVSEEVAGWTVVSDSQESIDAFKAAREDGALADSDEFGEAMDGLETDALARLYVSGDGLQAAAQSDPQFEQQALETFLPGGRIPSFAATLRAEENGARVDGNALFADDLQDGGFLGSSYAAELPEAVPAGVLFYLSFNDLEGQISRFRDAFAELEPGVERQLGQLEGMLGVSLEEDIAPLFANEGAFYVRRGALIPEFTLVLTVEDTQRALRTVDDLIAGLGRFGPLGEPREVEIAGVQAREVGLDAPVSLLYAAFDGKLVLTTAREGIADLREEGDRFADEEAFRNAAEEARLADETNGFGYVNLEEVVSLVLGFGTAAGQDLPPNVRENVEPLRHLVFQQSVDGRKATFSAFLSIE